MTALRTTLSRVRGLGSAKEGTGHFWHQRLTAIANIPLVLFLVGLMVALAGAEHAQVRAVLANPLVAVAVGLALVSVLIHMRLGMQIIIEDYVHGDFARLALIVLNIFFPVVVGAASLLALLTILFGG